MEIEWTFEVSQGSEKLTEGSHMIDRFVEKGWFARETDISYNRLLRSNVKTVPYNSRVLSVKKIIIFYMNMICETHTIANYVTRYAQSYDRQRFVANYCLVYN